jgi:hypothetical protein
MLVDDPDQVIVHRFGDIVWEKGSGPGAFMPPDPGDVDVILHGTRQEAAQGVLMVLKFSIELLIGGFSDFGSGFCRKSRKSGLGEGLWSPRLLRFHQTLNPRWSELEKVLRMAVRLSPLRAMIRSPSSDSTWGFERRILLR